MQEEEQAKIEKEKAELEEKIQNEIALANSLSCEEKKFYDTKFQEYLNAGDDENTSRSKALTDVNHMIQQKEYEAKRAADIEKTRLEQKQKAEQERIAAEQKAREEEEKAHRLAQAEQEKIARWGNKAEVKKYLEEVQPFALTNFIKNQAGIVGPLASGDIEPLKGHALLISSLAAEARKKQTEVSEQVADYLEYDAELALAYIATKSEKSNVIEKDKAIAEIPQLLSKQQDARNKIQEIANWCGADLSEYGETEFIRRLMEKRK